MGLQPEISALQILSFYTYLGVGCQEGHAPSVPTYLDCRVENFLTCLHWLHHGQGGFQVVYPLGLWSWSSGVVKVLSVT